MRELERKEEIKFLGPDTPVRAFFEPGKQMNKFQYFCLDDLRRAWNPSFYICSPDRPEFELFGFRSYTFRRGPFLKRKDCYRSTNRNDYLGHNFLQISTDRLNKNKKNDHE
jgi:hypothetical protein